MDIRGRRSAVGRVLEKGLDRVVRRARGVHGRRVAPHLVRSGGLDAAERFNASPAALSGFVVLQLLVYAALQVPVGLLLDRFGGRVLVTAGALTMAAGQLILAVATFMPVAIAARVLVGAGDAMMFISVLAVVSAWFPPRRVPLMTQMTGLVGQLGQVLSAVPFAALLYGAGWTPAFLSVAGVGWPPPSLSPSSCVTAHRVRRLRPTPRRRVTCCAGCGIRGRSPERGWGCGRTWAPSFP